MDFDTSERRQWADRADAYRRSFEPLCAHPAPALLDAADVRAGTVLLDVGTGTGTVAAAAYGRGATVTAVDAEPSMAAAARIRVPEATVLVGVLPALPLPTGAFDAVTANFVLNHVGDPAAALAELRRLTRPGGRFAATIWPYPAPTLQSLWADAVRQAGIDAPPGPRLDPERDFPRTEEGVAGLVAAAGWGGVTARRLHWRHEADVADWWSGAESGIGTFGQLVRGLDAASAARLRTAYEELAAPYVTGRRISAPTAALLVTAVREG
ncbi:class I SAM-dependent methyltransferase [Actinocatenispora rupis]|uniref:Methyltransferase type 11 domain-containing protein n=1 Tax=Actinocatenispora rupis TaxID=519421 RepID=A0A8J3J3A0_9ACTN|nr:class I SAM-dependent methyltransferase [Actinocatenispora rupis]GID10801.1 hypothetical protein Aru02nite_16900 [Actinocatenispora rupis]